MREVLERAERARRVVGELSGELRVNEAEPGSVFAGFPADVDALTPAQQLLVTVDVGGEVKLWQAGLWTVRAVRAGSIVGTVHPY